MSRRRRPGRGRHPAAALARRYRRGGADRGSFTAELAAGLPALMLLFLCGLTGVSALVTKIQCVDAAREGARAEARGDAGAATAARVAPAAATVSVGRDGDTIVVRVHARVPVLGAHLPALTVEGTAVAATEPTAGAVP